MCIGNDPPPSVALDKLLAKAKNATNLLPNPGPWRQQNVPKFPNSGVRRDVLRDAISPCQSHVSVGSSTAALVRVLTLPGQSASPEHGSAVPAVCHRQALPVHHRQRGGDTHFPLALGQPLLQPPVHRVKRIHDCVCARDVASLPGARIYHGLGPKPLREGEDLGSNLRTNAEYEEYYTTKSPPTLP